MARYYFFQNDGLQNREESPPLWVHTFAAPLSLLPRLCWSREMLLFGLGAIRGAQHMVWWMRRSMPTISRANYPGAPLRVRVRVRAEYVLMTQTTLDDKADVFFDPNTLAADGTKSLGPTAFSVGYHLPPSFPPLLSPEFRSPCPCLCGLLSRWTTCTTWT